MAIPTLVGSATRGSSTSGTTLTLTLPAGIANNDIGIAVIANSKGSSVATVTPPAGWTQLTSWRSGGVDLTTGSTSADLGQRVYTRTMVSTDSSTTAQWTFSTANSAHGVISIWRGVNTSTSIDVAPAPTTSTSGNTTAAALTTVTPDTRVLFLGSFGTSTTAPTVTDPSGMTGVATASSTVGSGDGSTYVGSVGQSTAGSTGSFVAGTSGGTRTVTGLLVLRPSAFTVPPTVNAIASQAGFVGQPFGLAAVAAAGQGGALSYSWASTSGPTPTFTTSSTAASTAVTFASAGTAVLTVTVTEAGGTTTSTTATIVVSSGGQSATPTTDVTTTGWTKTPAGAATFAAVLNDGVVSTSFATSPNTPSTSILRETMTGLVDPGGAAVTVSIYLAPAGATTWTIVVDVLQGGTVKATRTYTDASVPPLLTTQDNLVPFVLSQAEYNTITWPASGGNALDVRVTATAA